MSKQKQVWLAYLESAHWRDLRAQAFKRDGYKCTRCGSRHRLRGHHVKYSADLTTVPLKHILTLCEPCHTAHHREANRERKLRRRERRAERKTMSRLAWVIGWFDAR